MKNGKYYIYSIFLILLVTFSCDKSEFTSYDRSESSANFSTRITNFSFALSENEYDTVKIDYYINGVLADFQRKVNVSVLADSTTALNTEYKILSSVVDTNSYNGTLLVEVTKNDLDSIPDRRIWLNIEDSEDFTIGVKHQSSHILNLTSKLAVPYRWGNEKSYLARFMLGSYSTSYYKWLIDVTGHTQFPYPRAVPGYRDGLKWDYYYKKKFVAWLKDQLKAYNAKIAPDYLKHSDGIAEGEAVVIGYNKKP